MANEIYATYNEGADLYALIWRKSDDTVWNGLSSAFEPYTDDDIDKYDVPLTNHVDSDYYSVDFPAAITTSGAYRVQIMLRPGAIDADADFGIAQGEIQWGGTSEVTLLTLSSGSSKVLNVYGEGE